MQNSPTPQVDLTPIEVKLGTARADVSRLAAIDQEQHELTSKQSAAAALREQFQSRMMPGDVAAAARVQGLDAELAPIPDALAKLSEEEASLRSRCADHVDVLHAAAAPLGDYVMTGLKAHTCGAVRPLLCGKHAHAMTASKHGCAPGLDEAALEKIVTLVIESSDFGLRLRALNSEKEAHRGNDADTLQRAVDWAERFLDCVKDWDRFAEKHTSSATEKPAHA